MALTANQSLTESLAPGVWGVVATPFHGRNLDIDTDGLTNLARHYQRIGAAGLTVLGVFGEAASLTAPERKTVLETVTSSTDLPIVAGITSLATRPAIEEVLAAQIAAGDRLAAVMIQANSASASNVIAHLDAIHQATGANVVLQDYPLASGVAISTDSLITAVGQCPFIVAIKAEAAPTPVAVAKLTAAVSVSVFGGLGGQGLLDELMAGAAGAMTGFSYPEALIACVNAWRSDGFGSACAALAPYLPLVNFEQQAKIALSVRKECLRERGLISESEVRAPAVSFPESLRGSLLEHLRETAALDAGRA